MHTQEHFNSTSAGHRRTYLLAASSVQIQTHPPHRVMLRGRGVTSCHLIYRLGRETPYVNNLPAAFFLVSSPKQDYTFPTICARFSPKVHAYRSTSQSTKREATGTTKRDVMLDQNAQQQEERINGIQEKG